MGGLAGPPAGDADAQCAGGDPAPVLPDPSGMDPSGGDDGVRPALAVGPLRGICRRLRGAAGLAPHRSTGRRAGRDAPVRRRPSLSLGLPRGPDVRPCVDLDAAGECGAAGGVRGLLRRPAPALDLAVGWRDPCRPLHPEPGGLLARRTGADRPRAGEGGRAPRSPPFEGGGEISRLPCADRRDSLPPLGLDRDEDGPSEQNLLAWPSLLGRSPTSLSGRTDRDGAPPL